MTESFMDHEIGSDIIGADILGAFIDGERVDPAALKEALARPEGRDYLIDLLALRDLAGDVAPFIASAPPARPLSPLFPWAAAAALLVCIGGGFLAGARATRVALAPAATTAVPAPDARVRAPEPTRLVRLEPGINWTETSGGK
jgi:hypothetical protein